MEDKGTILKYLSKTLNTEGMGSKNGMMRSKRTYGMVEEQMVMNGSYGTLPKKLKLGQHDLTSGQGDAKSQTKKRLGNYALGTEVGVGDQDIRTFWNKGEELPRDLGNC